MLEPITTHIGTLYWIVRKVAVLKPSTSLSYLLTNLFIYVIPLTWSHVSCFQLANNTARRYCYRGDMPYLQFISETQSHRYFANQGVRIRSITADLPALFTLLLAAPARQDTWAKLATHLEYIQINIDRK